MAFDDAWTCLATLKILLIDSDSKGRDMLGSAMEQSGMRIAGAATGREGLDLKAIFRPDVVILDLNLPDTDGLAFVSRLVEGGDCGIIIVSSLTDEADRVVGLELGADDYICKPPSTRELLARVRAVHRRASLRAFAKPAPQGGLTITLGTLTIDLNKRVLTTPSGADIKLTGAEFTALETLVAAKGDAVSRECLCEAALRRPWRADDRGVDQLVLNLRKKLSDYGGYHRISTVRGCGYQLSVDSVAANPPLSYAA